MFHLDVCNKTYPTKELHNYSSLQTLAPWKKSYDKPRQCIKKQSHHFADKGPYSQSYGFSSSCVEIRELDHKEGWALKNWCFQIESPLDCKEIKPVDPKGIQPWMFTGRTPAEVESPLLWPLAVKSWLIGKDPDAGKNWGQEEKGTTENEMVGWHHQLNGHESEQIQQDSQGQGSLVVLQSMRSQRVGHSLVTEQYWNHIAISLFTQNKQTERPLPPFPTQ